MAHWSFALMTGDRLAGEWRYLLKVELRTWILCSVFMYICERARIMPAKQTWTHFISGV